jgi:UDPglucose 6-dehydrogenase
MARTAQAHPPGDCPVWLRAESRRFGNQRISSINTIATLCEATGAAVQEVACAIGSDSRLGPKFLKAGPGFGGSCFQNNILNLVDLCGHYGLHEVAAYWQLHRISRLVVNRLFGTVSGKRMAVLGFAYGLRPTPTTSRVDAGFSAGVTPAIRICRDLLEEGAQLAIFDPKVSGEQIAADLGVEALVGSEGEVMQGEGVWQAAADPFAAVCGADAVLLLTEWQQFRKLDWPALAAV